MACSRRLPLHLRRPSMARFPMAIMAACCLWTVPAVAGDDDRAGDGDQAAKAQQNGPQWRGPLGTGVAPDANPPIEWSESKNVRWKVELPGLGHSTRIVWDNGVFLSAAVP